MPVRIDEIESDIELEGDRSTETPRPGQLPPAESAAEVIERRSRDDERTRSWNFDD